MHKHPLSGDPLGRGDVTPFCRAGKRRRAKRSIIALAITLRAWNYWLSSARNSKDNPYVDWPGSSIVVCKRGVSDVSDS
ncbi:hypothetical protein BDV11DRAFT_180062 [Aspergillus similis]